MFPKVIDVSYLKNRSLRDPCRQGEHRGRIGLVSLVLAAYIYQSNVKHMQSLERLAPPSDLPERSFRAD